MKRIKSIEPYAIYTSEEAAKLLDVHQQTIQRYIKSGKIKATKIGNKWYRISGVELLRFCGVKV